MLRYVPGSNSLGISSSLRTRIASRVSFSIRDRSTSRSSFKERLRTFIAVRRSSASISFMLSSLPQRVSPISIQYRKIKLDAASQRPAQIDLIVLIIVEKDQPHSVAAPRTSSSMRPDGGSGCVIDWHNRPLPNHTPGSVSWTNLPKPLEHSTHPSDEIWIVGP